ncbi:MAG: glycosyltransferase family 2 protein [Acidimicrobiia bacterium]
MNGAPGAPWTLLALGGGFAVAIGVVGLDVTMATIATVLALLFLVFLLRHLAFAASAMSTARVDMRSLGSFDYGYRPRVSVLVPCRNEELVIEGLVTCLLALDYPADLLEILVVNDGSDDATGTILDELVERDSRLRAIHRPPGAPGGKSGALNCALVDATGDIIVVYDADHKPRADVIRRLVRHFADPQTGAVQGRCIVRNAEESKLALTIAVDYYCGYLVNEYGRQSLYDLPAYGGANCAVRASVLRAFGGWNENTVTEDTDLTMRIVLSGLRVRYDVTAIDTEESVSTFERFWRQRYRWARGHQMAWNDYRRWVWRAPGLTFAQRVETMMFLLVYHIPVACMFGAALIATRAVGISSWGATMDLTPIATLLFLGPLLELGAGLIVSRAPRRAAFGILLFVPAFVVFMIVCTKAWFDGIIGRPYGWHKTPRTGHGQVRTIDTGAVAAEPHLRDPVGVAVES